MTPGSHNHRTELTGIGIAVLDSAQKIDITEVDTAQKAMLLLHVEWEALVGKSRNRNVDGYEPIILAMKSLAATAVAVASVLQAKLMNAYERRFTTEEKDEVVFTRPVKDKEKVKPGRKKIGPGRRRIKTPIVRKLPS